MNKIQELLERKIDKSFENKFIEKYINKKFNNEYELLSIYNGDYEKICLKHKKCGNIFNITANMFKRKKIGYVCPYCEIVRKDMDLETLIYKKNNLLYGKEYEIIDFNKDIIRLKHKICNTEFNTTYYMFFTNGRKCPKCANNKKYTTDEYKEIVKKLTNNSYEMISDYKGERNKIRIKHNECGYEWNILPRNFIFNENRCPNCNSYIYSKYEIFIKKYLESKNIKFIRNKSFSDCKNLKGFNLYFDFYIEEKNIIIEFDGSQHFKPMKKVPLSELKFEKLRENDLIKNNYCINNNIFLYRIKYVFNYIEVKDILDKIFKNEFDERSTTIENGTVYSSKFNNLQYYE